jgi:plasmid stabilization system protein ParE
MIERPLTGWLTGSSITPRPFQSIPKSGRPGRVSDTRELVVPETPFIAPYRVRDDRVEILAVFHGARRWPARFD